VSSFYHSIVLLDWEGIRLGMESMNASRGAHIYICLRGEAQRGCKSVIHTAQKSSQTDVVCATTRPDHSDHTVQVLSGWAVGAVVGLSHIPLATRLYLTNVLPHQLPML
jgi:hypothetical protein